MAHFIYNFSGLKHANSAGDGTSVILDWYTAYPDTDGNKVAYTIYYSSNLDNLYYEGIKYIYNGSNTTLTLTGFDAGDKMFFAIRPYEYATSFDWSVLINVEPNLYMIPQSLLKIGMGKNDLSMYLMDSSIFPKSGTVLIGSELIRYDDNISNLNPPHPVSPLDRVSNIYSIIININLGPALPDNNVLVIGSNATIGVLDINGAPTNQSIFINTDSTSYLQVFISGTWAGHILIRSYITFDNYVIDYDNITEIDANGIYIIDCTKYIKIELISNIISGQANVNMSISGRGYQNTVVRPHSVDGTDTTIKWLYYRQGASLWIGLDNDRWDKHSICEIRYDYPTYPNNINGYRQIPRDFHNVDLSKSDALNENFPAYDYAGYHRQDPGMLIEGACLGTYQGGEMYCQDDETGVGRVLRGIPLQDRNTQRQEMLLRETGLNCVLLIRQTTGIVCKCVLMYNENPDPQCEVCLGSGFVHGYVQYFNPRNSDGRIKLRFSPYDDVVKLDEQGLDSEINVDAWGLTVPTIKQRDIIVKYDRADDEEFRYEVLSVSRNNTFHSLQGDQKIKLSRVRRTDQIYKIKLFSNTSMMPTWSNTTDMVQVIPTIPIPTNIASHTHQFRTNESTSDKWEQMSTKNAGHTHQIVFMTSAQFPNGKLVVLPILNHTHNLV
jgi:hypothetical protein